MKYSIVIPTYNHCDDLLQPCIESIFKYSDISDIELIVSANGCVDNTKIFLDKLKKKYDLLGLGENLKIVWHSEPLGYSKACNVGITQATTDLIVLLNNDTILLPQHINYWLELLSNPFKTNEKCGISCVLKGPSEPAGNYFAIFFCVMIHKKVFDKIGLLSLDYGVGGGEDTEFSIECERAGFEVIECTEKTWESEASIFTGVFPIYHKGEGTLHDKNLVPEWENIFHENSLTLARKYNRPWYQWALSNHSERAVFFKGDNIYPREAARYQFAANNLLGKKVLELGCSSGFGIQFLPKDIQYTGLDYDKHVIKAAEEQNWEYNCEFVCSDINKFKLDQYDTIIAFETIEHIANGLEVVEHLKKHCKRLIFTVPMNEKPGQFSKHHLIHNLNESSFKDCRFKYIDAEGRIVNDPVIYNDPLAHSLLLGIWDANNEMKSCWNLNVMESQNKIVYDEVILSNQYDITEEEIQNRTVIDIGANIGCLSLLAASKGAKMVIGVEPVNNAFNIFKQNVSDSGYKNIITLKNVVTNIDGVNHKISIGNENNGYNSLYNLKEDYEIVESITLDTILKLCIGDDIFLKLDCEGAEYDILMNATVESMRRIKTIVLEVHSDLHPVYKGRTIIENKLKELGFRNIKLAPVYFFAYDHNGVLVSTKEEPYSNQRWERDTEILNSNSDHQSKLEFIKTQHEFIYNEVIVNNVYALDFATVKNYEFIDIGANIGSFTLLTGYFNAKKIIAVEPISETYSLLCENIKKLNLNQVTTFKKAVGEIDGEKINLYSNTDSGLSSVYSASENYEVVETISLQTLMTYMKTDDVYLKCDCEGAEYDLLLNATEQDLARIKYIAIEIHENLHPKFKGSKILHDKFLKSGFHRIQEKRIFYWDFDQYGNKTNMRPSDIVVEIWKK